MKNNENKKVKVILVPLFLVLLSSVVSMAQTLTIFADTSVGQIKFAVSELNLALISKGFTSKIEGLTTLTTQSNSDRIVVGLLSNSSLTSIYTSSGGALPTGVGEQAFAIKTTSQIHKTYWVFGGDPNGAMYGGLELAENVKTSGIAQNLDLKQAPAILKRGIKLNLPWDQQSNTYGADKATSKIHAVPNVWDFSFWTTWFDEMARNRYNVISVWSNHPFTSMIYMEEYKDVALQGVKGLDGKVINNLSIQEKIAFWKKVMAYAKTRGFYFYLFNWNIFVENADGKYNITEDNNTAATSASTIKYMRKCMYTLWSTYPDLDGFGITQGENMSDSDEDDSKFLANTFGLGTVDFIKENPNRKVNLIHRWHLADFDAIKANFSEVFKYPKNITFDMSFKYSLAHMYSAALPQRMDDKDDVAPLVAAGLRSWLTVRNDDFYHHNWGDPDFAKAYINGMVNKGPWFVGFYMGSDGFSQTRAFFSKHDQYKNQLHVQYQWYKFLLWGRLAYNPNIPNSVFKNILAVKYPNVSSENLFNAWQKASRGLPKVGDIITGTLGRDDQWYPEASQSDQNKGDPEVFLTIAEFASANPSSGSARASIAATASGNLGGKISALVVADSIESDAKDALSLVSSIGGPVTTEQGLAKLHIQSLALLSGYYANKIKGAVHNKAGKKTEAISALGKAYCYWTNYSTLMDANYIGQEMARTADILNWKVHDSFVLGEYTKLAGANSKPNCSEITPTSKGFQSPSAQISGIKLTSSTLQYSLENSEPLQVYLYNTRGDLVFELTAKTVKNGFNQISIENPLKQGAYYLKLKAGTWSTSKKMVVVN